jgi:hypothetical protein
LSVCNNSRLNYRFYKYMYKWVWILAMPVLIGHKRWYNCAS